MKFMRKAQKIMGIAVVVSVLAAGAVVASWPTPVDPNGPNSGVGRMLASFPTIVEPNGPNSGMGRTLA